MKATSGALSVPPMKSSATHSHIKEHDMNHAIKGVTWSGPTTIKGVTWDPTNGHKSL